MSADDAQPTDSLTPDAEPAPKRSHETFGLADSTTVSGATERQTAAYSSMQRTMTDLSS
ncbi:hypothetical protein [Salinigranum sp. GCM10025319]|uniref:hypothetical protein n=1 Tax=Salinigranum sp. GCM10025319 TaxID=3252687 RepID=UPI00360FCD1A